MFTQEDLQQIADHGLTVEAVEQQIENFRTGFPYLNIARAASAGDGVKVLSGDEMKLAISRYEEASKKMKVVKTMKANEYKKMTSSDLEKELGELKSELFKLRFSLATNGLDNPMKIKEVKKDIARINTILRQRELEEKNA